MRPEYETAIALTHDLVERLAAPGPRTISADYGPRSRRWWDQSLSKGAAGVAVLHAARGRPDRAHRWLTRAVHEDVSAALSGCGLWFGAPAIAFAVRAAGAQRYLEPTRRLNELVTSVTRRRLESATSRIRAGVRPSLSEFDLVHGISGLGALLLPDPTNGEPCDQGLLRDVLTYLVRLTEPVPAADRLGKNAPGWWTTDMPSGPSPEKFAGGHADLGVAHGICGPLSLLALASLNEVRIPGQDEAIERICSWLDRWRQPATAGSWWPQRVTLRDLEVGQVLERSVPRRPSWCYGTPGVARAQQLAGIALDNRDRQRAAELALLQAVTDLDQLATLTDTSVCHGWAGTATTVWHAARDAKSPDLAGALPALAQRLCAQITEAPAQIVGLIEGSAGAALTLDTITRNQTNGWARCLLLI